MSTKPTYEIEKELHSAGYLRVAGVDEAGRGCEHPSGEVLTDNGWKSYKDINIKSDKVLSYTKVGEIVWQSIDFVVEKDFNGELLSLVNRSASLLITNDHSFDVLRRTFKRNEDYVLQMTGYTYSRRSCVTDLKSNDFIPRGGLWVGSDNDFFILPSVERNKHDTVSTCNIEKQIPMDLWLKFLGIYLAEGSTVVDKIRGDYKITISQFKKKQRAKIYKELKALPFGVRLEKGGIIITGKQIALYTKKLGLCYDKYVPKDIKNLPPHRLKVLLDWMLLGDGSSYKGDNRKRVYMYYTTSKKLRDDFEEVVLKTGRTYKTVVRQPRDSYIRGRKLLKENCVPCFEIRIRQNTKICAKYLHKNHVKYSGKVFCLGLSKHHNFYIRRDGSGYFTGNCLAGPVIAAACVVPEEVVPLLESKVNDSKKLSAKKREELFDLIRDCCDVGVGVVNNETIDEINILNATKLAMEEALLNLKVFDYAIIDGTVVIPKFPKPQQQVIKGDAKSISIAAASIVAKVIRDRIMDDLHDMWPIYGWDTNRAYGTKVHIEALKTYGPCLEHRLTFNKVVW